MKEQRVVEFKGANKRNFDSWLEDSNREGWYIKNIFNWKTTIDADFDIESVYCVVLMERELKR